MAVAETIWLESALTAAARAATASKRVSLVATATELVRSATTIERRLPGSGPSVARLVRKRASR